MLAQGYIVPGICLFAGSALVLFEAFIPGFGIAGLSGFAMLLLGTTLLSGVIGVTASLAVLVVLIILLGVLAILVFRAAAKGRLHNERIFLKTTAIDVTEGAPRQVLLGAHGVAKTALRPSGIAEFDGQKLSVVAEGEYIPAGAKVEVILLEGARIVVRSTKD